MGNLPFMMSSFEGPMSRQMDDFSVFWKMIWQQKVDKIVMLTNLMEEMVRTLS